MSNKDDDHQKRPDPRDSTALTALSSADSSFAGFVDTVEGEDDEAVNLRMIQGTRVKFNKRSGVD
jgi:hypothetical protein